MFIKDNDWKWKMAIISCEKLRILNMGRYNSWIKKCIAGLLEAVTNFHTDVRFSMNVRDKKILKSFCRRIFYHGVWKTLVVPSLLKDVKK